MTTHRVKSHPEYFALAQSGVKQFELRINDRGYAVGDFLHQVEYEPMTGAYSGDELLQVITCVISGPWLAPGFVALGVINVPLRMLEAS